MSSVGTEILHFSCPCLIVSVLGAEAEIGSWTESSKTESKTADQCTTKKRLFAEIKAGWLNCRAVQTMMEICIDWWLAKGVRTSQTAGAMLNQQQGELTFSWPYLGDICFLSKQFGTEQSLANVTNHLMFGTCLQHKHVIRQHFVGPD